MMRLLFALSCAFMISGCDLAPRGAGLQSEVLAVSADHDPNLSPEFAVEVVTQSNLATFVRWPVVDGSHLGWIDRVDQPDTRTIGSGDIIIVTIWTAEENGLLTTAGQRSVTLQPTQVSSGGTISLPYIEDIRVRGMSQERARAVLEDRYEGVTASAQVQIEVREGRERTVSLVGGVASPGTYTLDTNDYTMLELLADGGGVRAGLSNPQIRLQRDGRTFGTSVERVFSSASLNTTLEGGDRVFIQDDDRTFLSLGAAGTEAIHAFPTDRVSALEALAIIGGVAESRADAQGILILRRYPVSQVTTDRSGPDHPRTVFTIDLTSADGLFSAGQFEIQSGDLVYVSESPIVAIGSVLGILGAAIGFGAQLN